MYVKLYDSRIQVLTNRFNNRCSLTIVFNFNYVLYPHLTDILRNTSGFSSCNDRQLLDNSKVNLHIPSDTILQLYSLLISFT